ncbi:MAG: hypothetical protein LH628_27515 [Microcoleus sp. CAN_BIN18]|nr:hypothetical protein [Microcoleus sp. CAN_BIN18]
MILLFIIKEYFLDSPSVRRLRCVQLAMPAANPTSSDTPGLRVAWPADHRVNFRLAFLGGRIQALKSPQISESSSFSGFRPEPQLRSTFSKVIHKYSQFTYRAFLNYLHLRYFR